MPKSRLSRFVPTQSVDPDSVGFSPTQSGSPDSVGSPDSFGPSTTSADATGRQRYFKNWSSVPPQPGQSDESFGQSCLA